MPATRATIGCNIDILKVTVIDFAPCPLGFVSGPGGDPCRQRVAQICLRVCTKGRITSAVNAGEKMHRRAGVRLHQTDGRGRPRERGTRSSSLTLNSAFQFDPMSLLSRPDLGSLGHGAQRRGWEERSHAQRRSELNPPASRVVPLGTAADIELGGFPRLPSSLVLALSAYATDSGVSLVLADLAQTRATADEF
jgi:hypothetical protein